MLVNAPCAECSLSTECIWMHRVRMQVNAPSECSWMLRVQNAPCHMNAFECTHIPNVFECMRMHWIGNAYVCFRMLLVQNAPCHLNACECTLIECKWMHQVNALECSAYRMLPAMWMHRTPNAYKMNRYCKNESKMIMNENECCGKKMIRIQ